MLVFEAKITGTNVQYALLDEAIRTARFIRNKALRFWMDNRGVNGHDLNKYCAVLAKQFPFADKQGLNGATSVGGKSLVRDNSFLRKL